MKKVAIVGCGASGTIVLADITIYHYGTPIAREDFWGITRSATIPFY